MFGQLVDEATLPVRKRRRPALSCIECRRRKIKCDRNSPCNHCKQTKNSSCVYKDHHTAASSRRFSPPSQAAQHVVENQTQVPTLDDSYPNEFSYQLLSHTSSPKTTTTLQDWDISERSSITSTRATTISDNQSQNNDPCLAYRLRSHEQSLPDAMTATDEEITGKQWAKALGISFSTFNDVIVQDGDLGARLRTKFFNESLSTPIKEIRGSMSKTRYFGQTHWMNSFEQFYRICSIRDKDFLSILDSDELKATNAEVRRSLEQCKNIARAIKAQRSVNWHLNPDFKDYIPARPMADILVNLYLRTMESTHRILHVPQFLREYERYWDNPEKTSSTSIVKILLVMAIGSCFYQEADHAQVRESAQQWVYSAQSWVAAPFEKGRMNLSGLQVHCLLLIARQTNALGGDLMWIGSGALLRCAFQMGFHRDPKWFPKISVMHGELRRRLWATVLELSVQTSLDTGMPPLISINDYDTEPPLNIDDEDMCETTEVPPVPKPPHIYTQSSLQIQLLKSLAIRLQISNILNSIQPRPSYDQILRLGSEIAQASKENALLMKSYSHSLPHPTDLQRKLLDMFLRRFTLAIHRPFVTPEPRYYYSRKTCVDTAMIIMSHLARKPSSSSSPVNAGGDERLDDYTQLCTVGGGFYKEMSVHGGAILALELIQQMEEDILSGLPPSASSLAARQPIRDSLEVMMELATRRIKMGENNVKCFLFLSAAMGQVKALEEGGDLDRCIIQGAKFGAQKCLELLRARAKIHLTPEVGAESAANPDEASWQGDMIGGNTGDYGYNFVMQDDSSENMANFNFDILDSWLFAGWGENGGL